jgi:hypothetical protein
VSRIPIPILRLLALTLLFSLGPVSHVLAQSTPEPEGAATPEPLGGPEFVLRPADGMDGEYFTLEAEAGSSNTLTAVLGNAGDEPLTLMTYAGDGVTLVNGGFGVREADEPKEDVGSWVDYETDTIDFEPGQGLEREFTVTIPDDAAPGQYIAGIVLQTAEPIEIEGSAMFDQIIRKTVAVFITVPGELTPAFAFGTPEIEGSALLPRMVIPVSNTGNVLVKPAGELVLTDAAGNDALRQPFTMGSVYAGMETTLEIPLPAALQDGDYTVSVEASDAETEAQAAIEPVSVTLARDAEEAPLEITAAEVAPMPSAEEPQFAAVSVTVTNRATPIDGVQVVLNVARDGEPVEDFVLSSSVTLQQGETVVEQRYIPLEGWSSGEWTFAVTLESIDPQTNAQASLLSETIEDPIVIAD